MRIVCFIIALIVSINSINAFAWSDGEGSTHEKITQKAIKNSKLENYLNNNLNLNIGKSITGEIDEGNTAEKEIDQWLFFGSKEEDKPLCRASNHFHDPIKPWGYSGMTTLGSIVTWWCGDLGLSGGDEYPPSEIKSAVFFATGYLEPSPNGWNATDNDNSWDWDNARNYYHIYLTGEDVSGNTMATTVQEREKYFGKSLRALGQVLHLLQDMSVPAHTRDDFWRDYGDGHSEKYWWALEGTTYLHGEELEVFVARNGDAHDNDWFTTSDSTQIFDHSLTDFWDSEIYNETNPEDTWLDSIGLAEFSNANFITRATADKYPHPNVDVINWSMIESITAEDGYPDDRIYLRKTGPLEYRLATPGYLTKDLEYAVGQLDMVKKSLIIDEEVKSDYAKILIPKAINYSSALIDYFFRGEILVLPYPEYISTEYADNELSEISIKMKNICPTEEAMFNGKLKLVVNYRPIGGNVDGSDDIFVQAYANPECTMPEYSVETLNYGEEGFATFYFKLNENLPITKEIVESGNYNFEMRFAYKGGLGNEKQAVIGKILSYNQIFDEQWNNGLTGDHAPEEWAWDYWADNPDGNYDNGVCKNNIVDGALIKENIRYADSVEQRNNESTIKFTDINRPQGIKVTPNMYTHFKIDEITKTGLLEGEVSYQYLSFDFRDSEGKEMHLHFTKFDQFGSSSPTTAKYSIEPSIDYLYNFYDSLKQKDITFTEPLYLKQIQLQQQLWFLTSQSTNQHVQRMAVDTIQVIDGAEEEDETSTL